MPTKVTPLACLFTLWFASAAAAAGSEYFVQHFPGKPCQIIRDGRPLHPDLRTQIFPVPGKDRVYFVSWDSGMSDLYCLEGNTIRRLTQNPSFEAAPALDSRGRLYYASDRSGHIEIWRLDPDGKDVQVTRFGAYTTHPLPLPDGTLVVSSNREHPGKRDPKTADGQFDLYLLDATGKVLKKLTDGVGDSSSPARLEDRMLFANNRTGRLEIYELAQGKIRQLTHSRLPDRERNVYAPVVFDHEVLVSVHETLRNPRLSGRELRYVARLGRSGALTPLTDPRRSNASTKGF